MIAIMLVGIASAIEVSPVDGFKSAAFDASQAVGTSGFSAAFSSAQFRCDDAVAGCEDVLARLKAADAAARAPKPEASAPVVQAQPEAAVAEVEDVGYFYAPPPAPGHRYDYTTTRGNRVVAEQHGFRVDFSVSWAEGVAAACFWKEDAPTPVGPDETFRMGRDGRSFMCAAVASPYGQTFVVPDDTTIYLARDGGDGSYVVYKTVTCGTNNGTSPVVRKMITDCLARDVR